MARTMVVIGEHIQEAEFGRCVRDYANQCGVDWLEFYEVVNSYNNASSGGKWTDAVMARKEIYDKVNQKNPPLIVNLHSDTKHNADRAAIFAWSQYGKVKPLERIGEGDLWHGSHSIMVLEGPIQFVLSRVFEQPDFPYVGLEIMLYSEKLPPFTKQCPFALGIIKDLSKLYGVDTSKGSL